MRRKFSTSLLLYTRCPDFDLSGAKFGNSVSQNRRTYGSTPRISQTSLILKKSLSGISRGGMASSRLRTLFDYNRRPREWKPLADAVLNESLEREVQFLNFVRKHDERRWVGFDLCDVFDFHISGQSASRQDFR